MEREVSVDKLIFMLIDKYVDHNLLGVNFVLKNLADIGIDKYTALEIAMNELPDYLNEHYRGKDNE